MVDTYYIPQKTTAPAVESAKTPAPQPVNRAALKQAVQEAVRAALPKINAVSYGSVTLHITVHIHL
jgi:predicted neutral ceramidase superfamily lipid hydrolase